MRFGHVQLSNWMRLAGTPCFNLLIDCVCLFVQGATSLIHKIGATDGIFLIRKSSKGDTYALTLCHEQQIFHYEIKVLVSAKDMECI